MFIHSTKYEVGSTQITAKDIVVMKGTLLKGSLVIITGKSSRGYNIRDLDSGEEFIEISSTFDNLPIFE